MGKTCLQVFMHIKKVVSAQGIPSSLPVTQSACQPASLQFASLQYCATPLSTIVWADTRSSRLWFG